MAPKKTWLSLTSGWWKPLKTSGSSFSEGKKDAIIWESQTEPQKLGVFKPGPSWHSKSPLSSAAVWNSISFKYFLGVRKQNEEMWNLRISRNRNWIRIYTWLKHTRIHIYILYIYYELSLNTWKNWANYSTLHKQQTTDTDRHWPTPFFPAHLAYLPTLIASDEKLFDILLYQFKQLLLGREFFCFNPHDETVVKWDFKKNIKTARKKSRIFKTIGGTLW